MPFGLLAYTVILVFSRSRALLLSHSVTMGLALRSCPQQLHPHRQNPPETLGRFQILQLRLLSQDLVNRQTIVF
jgi:hypothetical protein